MVEEEILADAPDAYYTLGEPADHAGQRLVRERAAPLFMTGDGPAVVFGNATGPGTDGLTAAEFAANGQRLIATNSPMLVSDFSCGFFYSTTATFVSIFSFLSGLIPGSGLLSIGIDGTGQLAASILTTGGSLNLFSGSPANDGETRQAALVYESGTYSLYMDGALVDSAADSDLAAAPSHLLLGDEDSAVTLSHVSYGASVSALRVAAQAAAGLEGFVGDTPADRMSATQPGLAFLLTN